MTPIKIHSHIMTQTVHGGYDDAASVTLWVDTEAGTAHLCGHSGGMIPLAGPQAPDHAPIFEVIGKSGWIAIFDEEEIEGQVHRLEEALATWLANGRGEADGEVISEVLGEFDLEMQSYAEYLKEEDPETYEELYGA